MALSRLKNALYLIGGAYITGFSILFFDSGFKQPLSELKSPSFAMVPRRSAVKFATASSSGIVHTKQITSSTVANSTIHPTSKQLEISYASVNLPQTKPRSNQHASALARSTTVSAHAENAPKTMSENASYVTGLLGLGRLGNDMFMYACAFAAALRHNLTAGFFWGGNTLDAYRDMQSIFRLSSELYNDTYIVDKTISEKGFGKYNNEVEDRTRFGRITLIRWYLQSFKYFHAYERAIRSEFTLTEKYANLATEFLGNVSAGRLNVTFVGVHVRRGDMVDNNLYIPAPITYIVMAMNYFILKYGGHSTVQFIVASNDQKWTLAAIENGWNYSNVAYTKETHLGDMAILSRCNHSIVTLGSFGWWTAWLAGGEVVYYSQFIPNSSWLFGFYKAEDYYPSSWIGMA